MTEQLTINEQGYLFTYRAEASGFGDCWQVTANGKRTDRFYRTYIVPVNDAGQPKGCTCPDHVYRQRVCKHMDAVRYVSMCASK